MRCTVFQHVWNEEFLLPFWLRHHVPLFDHGVFFDYGSTDRTEATIREMAPSWEFRRSRNGWFDACACDQEIMEEEARTPGWKMVLNATEFLMLPDLREYTDWLEKTRRVTAVWTSSWAMVDREEDRNGEVDSAVPLHRQRFHGVQDEGRHRLLHCFPHGQYRPGRHETLWRDVSNVDHPVLLWWGFSPLKQTWERKLAIQTRIPEKDKRGGFGHTHCVTPEQLEVQYQRLAKVTFDLRTVPEVRAALEAYP